MSTTMLSRVAESKEERDGLVNEILQHVASQMEQEHIKRIKLEAQVEKLTAAKRLHQVCTRSRTTKHCSRNFPNSHQEAELRALKAQVEGYKQLVGAMTNERPAIVAAMLREQQRLQRGWKHAMQVPLNIIRLLEIIPWHPSAQAHINVQDAIYEWQLFDPINKSWKADLPSFPNFFHALPVATSLHDDHEEKEDKMEKTSQEAEEDEEESCLSDDEGSATGSNSSDNETDTTTTASITSTKEEQSSATTGGQPSLPEATTSDLVPRQSKTIDATTRETHKSGTNFDFPSFMTGLLPPRTNASLDHRPQKEAVLTNANLTKRFVLNSTEGLLLPNPKTCGTWKWIGHWMIDRALQPKPEEPQETRSKAIPPPIQSILKFFDFNHNEHTKPQEDSTGYHCDKEGWTYAREASHFLLWNAKQLCWADEAPTCQCRTKTTSKGENKKDEAIVLTSSTITSTSHEFCPHCQEPRQQRRKAAILRRRKWIRQRVLVDYPMACESTQEYLRITAHNASMALATHELQTKLKETTEALERVQDHAATSQTTQTIQLDHYQKTWEAQQERIKSLRYGKFKRKIEELTCKQDDILPIIANPDLFLKLQKALRQSGAITNAMLQQGIHFYIQDHVRQRGRRRPQPPS